MVHDGGEAARDDEPLPEDAGGADHGDIHMDGGIGDGTGTHNTGADELQDDGATGEISEEAHGDDMRLQAHIFPGMATRLGTLRNLRDVRRRLRTVLLGEWTSETGPPTTTWTCMT